MAGRSAATAGTLRVLIASFELGRGRRLGRSLTDGPSLGREPRWLPMHPSGRQVTALVVSDAADVRIRAPGNDHIVRPGVSANC
jgi:hypothetical protein